MPLLDRDPRLVGDLAIFMVANDLKPEDVSNPEKVLKLGTYNTPGSANGVEVVGHLAYVADGASGLQVLDVGERADAVVGDVVAAVRCGLVVARRSRGRRRPRRARPAAPGGAAGDERGDEEPGGEATHHRILIALDESRQINNGQPSLWAFLLDQLGKRIMPEFIQIAERPHIPCGLGSASFDSGGRLYGGCSSSETTVISASPPASR